MSIPSHKFVLIPSKVHWIIGLLLVLSSCGGSHTAESPVSNKTITGTITIPEFVFIDSDVNDPNAQYASNDTVSTAQVLPNPVMVGGYLNIAGKGQQGRSMATGDMDDYYFVTLLSGQIVKLTVGNPGDAGGGLNDLDMVLIDDQGQQIQSQQSGNVKTVSISSSGDYYIKVSAVSGASDYLLDITLNTFQAAQFNQPSSSVATNQNLNSNMDFVPGQIIVKYKNATTITAQVTSSKGELLHRKAGSAGRSQLYQLSDTTSTGLITPLNTTTSKSTADLKRKTLEVINELRKRPDVESARPNYIRRKMATPNDQYYRYQWSLPLINLPQAWGVTTGSGVDGNNVIVAVIDTGILPDHPDLQGQILNGYDFISDSTNAADGDGIDGNPYDEGDGINGAPSSFHGTHVAGIIAATTNNKIGVGGVAWDAKIMPLRVLGKSGGTDYDIEQAIRYAAGLDNDSGTKPAQQADVINLSLGGLTNSTVAPEAYTLARQAGVIIVAAAGNESTNQLSYPASLDGVVSVSSVGYDKSLAPYSNYGSTVDITAPGGNTSVDLNRDGYVDGILSTLAQENSNSLSYVYAFYQGTSMAAPHVAGVAALMKAVYRQLTPDEFDQWLTSGLITEDLGTTGRDDYYGNGLIDAYKAVNVASSAAGNSLPPASPTLATDKALLNFSYDLSNVTFSISNSGGGSLAINSIQEDSGGWLTISSQSVDKNGLGSYSASINRSALPSAVTTVSANITITSSAGNLTLPVLVLDATQNYASDAGIHYIRLMDSSTGQIVKQTQAVANNGHYTYSLEDVPPGHYILLAGSDPDNNGSICGAAEACGQYFEGGNGGEITITDTSADVLDLNFETGFYLLSITKFQTTIFQKTVFQTPTLVK